MSIIKYDNLMTWTIGGMLVFMVGSVTLAYTVQAELIFLLFGAIGWFAFTLFYLSPKLYDEEIKKYWEKSDQNVADHMRDERLAREKRK